MNTEYIVLIVIGLLVALVLTRLWWFKRREPDGWYIGPMVHGTNFSKNLPKRPTLTNTGWKIKMEADSELDSVTIDTGPLPKKGFITATLLLSNPLALYPSEQKLLPAGFSIFIQRKGDNWSAKGEYEHYRWYSPIVPLNNTLKTLRMPLDADLEQWRSIMGQGTPEGFYEALANASRVGIVFGWEGGRSHGILTRYPSTIELIEWKIESA